MRQSTNLDETLTALEALDQRKTFERWHYYNPVPRHEEFFAAGAGHKERLFMAANGSGKTSCASYEVSRHMTGEYPPWWKGRRFDRPVRVWAAGTSAKAVTEAAQTKLLGPPGVRGTGMIPRDRILGEPRAGRGYADAVDSFQVRWGARLDDSAVSRCVLKTYEQKRDDWQGADIDLLWCDEEPPEELYSEGWARLRGRGMGFITFTPLKGMTSVVLRFLESESADRAIIRMGLRDATWYTEDEKRAMMAGYPASERSARIDGEPMLGSGRVFNVPEDDIRIPAIPLERIPPEWAKIWGTDFGGGSEDAHPFAAALLAWDREDDAPRGPGPIGTVYVLAEVRMTNSLILQHATAMKRIAGNVPVAWPHDGHWRERSSGESLAALYRAEGLRMLETHATHSTGGFSTYAGIADMDAYLQARRFKVFDTCPLWLGEYAQYHYRDGALVRIRDDLMSATRTAHIMRRRARPGPLGRHRAGTRSAGRPDVNPWTGRPALFGGRGW